MSGRLCWLSSNEKNGRARPASHIGQELRINKERVRQIEVGAEAKLCELARREVLKPLEI